MGHFIIFEGPDGCGKTTQAKLLTKALKACGQDAIYVKEPGSTWVGDCVRTILLDPNGGNITRETEIALFFAARTQLLQELILPQLDKGGWVICDRYMLSSYVYQVLMKGVPSQIYHDYVNMLARLDQRFIGDLMLYFHTTPENIIARNENKVKDRMELTIDEMNSVYTMNRHYNAALSQLTLMNHIRSDIEADDPIMDVHDTIISRLKRNLYSPDIQNLKAQAFDTSLKEP